MNSIAARRLRRLATRGTAAAFFLLSAAAASANGGAAPPKSNSGVPHPLRVPGSEQESAPSTSETATLGPQSCSAMVPSAANLAPPEAPALVRITITTEGAMRDPQIFRSSGDPKLDEVAVACAKGNRFPLLKVNESPAEITWVFALNAPNGFLHPAATLDRDVCQQHTSGRLFRHPPSEDTMLAFQVATDGRVENLKLTQSSGDSDLDEMTSKCVVSYRYFPATENGRPTPVDQKLRVRWRVGPPR